MSWACEYKRKLVSSWEQKVKAKKSHKLTTTTTRVCPTRTTTNFILFIAVGVQLQSFTDYVKSTWIESAVWPPSCWSVYLQAKRTNNDVAGWHFHLNRQAPGKSQLLFYLLLQLPHREAQIAAHQARRCNWNLIKRCFEANKDNFASLWCNRWLVCSHSDQSFRGYQFHG